MRAFAWFLGAIGGTLLLAALLAFPVWQVAHAADPDWPFHRVVSRFWQLLLLLGLLVALRRLHLSSRADWGYGLARPAFLRQAGAGFALGLATMLPMTLAMLALDILAPRAGLDAAALLKAFAAGALMGLAVALVEETFFRGLMYRAVSRESGHWTAAWLTALVYAAIHFFARTKIPADEVAWDSGFRLLGGVLTHFANPLPVLDSFVTLLLVGLLLAGVRQRTGAIAACIGLHAGWVSVIKATKDLTVVDAEAAASFLVGPFDGYTGWLVAGWSLLLFALAIARGWLKPPAVASRA
ncbi:MAG: CPBP family intramembrane metalloprotease [Gammaproteobacteria bacterium]|nr:CPBP family intramembrane metalloprotease [Gammaproteobacteria bacterium]